MDNNNNNNEKIFKSVFGNIVLLRNIYGHVKKLKEYEKCIFSDPTVIRNYENRDYVTYVEYNGSMELCKGDLPYNGVLKHVRFVRKISSHSNGDIIPFGVESVEYSINSFLNNTHKFSTLPSTINTLKNVTVKPIDNSNDISIYEQYSIPPNITSISFCRFPNITSSPGLLIHGLIKIPNTIKELHFNSDWDNQGLQLIKGDLPEGIISLKMIGYNQIGKLQFGVLPSTIKYLEIKCIISNRDYEFEFLPINLESLSITIYSQITINSKLYNKKSIKNLFIDFGSMYTLKSKDAKLQANSLPNSITNLSISNLNKLVKLSIPNGVTNLELLFNFDPNEKEAFEKGSIPNTVKILKINKIITETDIIPSSIDQFELTEKGSGFETYSTTLIDKMIKLLPSSITSIVLPKLYSYNHKNWPKTNVEIIYKKI